MRNNRGQRQRIEAEDVIVDENWLRVELEIDAIDSDTGEIEEDEEDVEIAGVIDDVDAT